MRLHQHCRGVGAGRPGDARTVEHKAAVLVWVSRMAEAAGAVDPESLARGLTLLLDGGLAAGVLDADPGGGEAAKQAARVLVDTGRAGDDSGRREGHYLTAR